RTGLAELRTPGGAAATCQAIRAVTSGDGPTRLSPGIDLCIDLVRDLKTSDAAVDDIRSLSYSALEWWAYHDTTGDRHRAAGIVPHNAPRIRTAALAVAVDLAPSFGLTVEVPPLQAAEVEVTGVVRPGTTIALYSLQEQALGRAAKILRERHPGLEVVVSADHV